MNKESQLRAKLTFFVVVLPGFEPGQTEPKPVVLPLHHRTILIVLSFEERCKNCASESKQMKFDFVNERSQSSQKISLQRYAILA